MLPSFDTRQVPLRGRFLPDKTILLLGSVPAERVANIITAASHPSMIFPVTCWCVYHIDAQIAPYPTMPIIAKRD